jgi:hypothetical protein
VRIDDLTAPSPDGLHMRGLKLSSNAPKAHGPNLWGFEVIVDRGDADDAAWRSLVEFAKVSQFAVCDADGRALPQFRQEPRDEGRQLVIPVRLQRAGVRNGPADALPGAPKSFEWRLPVELKEIHIPLEFKDLSLP